MLQLLQKVQQNYLLECYDFDPDILTQTDNDDYLNGCA
jgi:hypothetical protein